MELKNLAELSTSSVERRKKTTVKFEKSHGGREKYFPTELKKDMTGDCAIRACAIATGVDYMVTMKRMFELGLEKGLLPNDDNIIEIFLFENGFKKFKQLRNNKNKMFQVNQFPADKSKNYVIRMIGHLTAIVKGVHMDTSNCGEWCARSFYSK